MKTIVSSLYLQNTIAKALNKRIEKFSVNKNGLVFHCEKSKVGLSLYDVEKPFESIFVQADPLQWKRAYDFLKSIPEQPIVMEIEHYSDKDINIIFTGLTAKF